MANSSNSSDIFRNIGQSITAPIGNLWQGVYEGLAPGAFQQVRAQSRQHEFQNKLNLLRSLPQTSSGFAELGRELVEEYVPEMKEYMARMGAGAFTEMPEVPKQPYNIYAMNPQVWGTLTPEQQDAIQIYNRQKAGAGDDLGRLQKLLDLEEAVKWDYPELGKNIGGALDKMIEDISKRLPGAQPRPYGPEPKPETGELPDVQIPKGEPSLWQNLQKGLEWGVKIGGTLFPNVLQKTFPKTGEGYPAKISGRDKQYGKPSKEGVEQNVSDIGKDWIADDTRLYVEPPSLEGKITNWMDLSNATKKDIWLGYEEGLNPEEMQTIAQLESKASKIPLGLMTEIRQALRTVNPRTGKNFTVREIVKDRLLREQIAEVGLPKGKRSLEELVRQIPAVPGFPYYKIPPAPEGVPISSGDPYHKLSQIWFSLPLLTQRMVWLAHKTGYTWSQILETKEIEGYLTTINLREADKIR